MEKSKEETKEIILNAAINIFADKGLNDAKIYEIAAKADVAIGVIYSYFEKPVKLDILLEIFIDFWKKLNALTEKKISEFENPKEKLIAVFDVVSELLVKDTDAIFKAKVIGESLPYLLIKKNKKMKGKREIITFENHKFLVTLDDIILTGQKTGKFYDDLKPSIIRQFLYGAIELSIYGLFLKTSRNESIGYEVSDMKEGTVKLFDRFLCK